MRRIPLFVGIAAAALMASSAQSASTTSLRDECQRIARPGDVCVLGRVTNDQTLLALVTTQDLPIERPAVWASDASEPYRRIPGLDRFTGRLVMVSGYWTNGALFHARVLMVPTYARRRPH